MRTGFFFAIMIFVFVKKIFSNNKNKCGNNNTPYLKPPIALFAANISISIA